METGPKADPESDTQMPDNSEEAAKLDTSGFEVTADRLEQLMKSMEVLLSDVEQLRSHCSHQATELMRAAVDLRQQQEDLKESYSELSREMQEIMDTVDDLFSTKKVRQWLLVNMNILQVLGVLQLLAVPAFMTLTHGEFMGLDDDTNSVHSAAPVVVAPHPRETLTYIYKTGIYGACSATCNGGMQYRSVECLVQDAMNPRVVEETYCITQRLQRPQSQQACNMHSCAEYSVSSFSVCSVTCGEGQQTREVHCVGPGGERLAESACSGQARPASVQVCRRPACHMHITWHVTDYGLCTRSCGGGVRERRVSCFDMDLNPYPEARCGLASRPVSVETCNSQPCPRAQMVPSVQDPRAHETTMRGFVPHVPGDPSDHRQTFPMIPTLLWSALTVHSHFMAAVLMAKPLPLDLGMRAASKRTVFAAGAPISPCNAIPW
ncbi:hypothetical protein INR49_028598 [Caranx melampygus]|nr:hypothetical protein INR49_028598 [Caranx melampygus]